MKLSSKLPDGQNNGLDAVAGRLTRSPEDSLLVIGVLDVGKLTTDLDTGDVEPTVRLRFVEAVPSQHADDARQLLESIRATRTGEPLPFDDTDGGAS